MLGLIPDFYRMRGFDYFDVSKIKTCQCVWLPGW